MTASDIPLDQTAAIDWGNFYLIVGALVVMNMGAIGGGVVLLIKLVWAASKYDSRIQKMEKDINAAHQKLREHGHDV